MAGGLEGWVCTCVAVLFFGSNFTVVQKYDAGDGMFFQLVLCLGIWSSGLVVYFARSCPTFYAFASVGGVLWCTGNCFTVFIIEKIGLGPGLVTWGTMANVIGWVSSFFGLFGLPSERESIRNSGLNVLGFLLSIVALAVSTLIRKAPPRSASPATTAAAATCAAPLNDPENALHEARSVSVGAAPCAQSPQTAPVPAQIRRRALAAALLAGTCYGLNFHPAMWIQHHVESASQDGLDYVFSHFCGILLASVCYFLIYCAVRGNKPWINPELVLPGFVSGVMWGVAQTCWFVANAELGPTAAFPIIVIAPGFIGSMWSVFLFKDIYGRRNYAVLMAFFAIAALSCLCIVVSKG